MVSSRSWRPRQSADGCDRFIGHVGTPTAATLIVRELGIPCPDRAGYDACGRFDADLTLTGGDRLTPGPQVYGTGCGSPPVGPM